MILLNVCDWIEDYTGNIIIQHFQPKSCVSIAWPCLCAKVCQKGWCS